MENRDSMDFAGILDGHTESEVYDASEDDKELAKRLKDWFSGAFDARQPYERDWELYRLYLKGDQLVGKLSRSIPTCTVLPATADFDEQHGARVASRFLEVLRRKERLDRKYLEINNKLPWAGNAFAQVVWDHTGGRDLQLLLSAGRACRNNLSTMRGSAPRRADANAAADAADADAARARSHGNPGRA